MAIFFSAFKNNYSKTNKFVMVLDDLKEDKKIDFLYYVKRKWFRKVKNLYLEKTQKIFLFRSEYSKIVVVLIITFFIIQLFSLLFLDFGPLCIKTCFSIIYKYWCSVETTKHPSFSARNSKLTKK